MALSFGKLAALVLAWSTSAASAQDWLVSENLRGSSRADFYMGAAFGTSHWWSSADPARGASSSSEAGRWYVGWDLDPLLAVEMGYVALGQTYRPYQSNRAESSFDAMASHADVLVKLPLNKHVEPFVKVGTVASAVSAQGPAFPDDDSSLSSKDVKVGLGVRLMLGRHVTLRGDVDYYTLGAREGLGGLAGVSSFTVGANIRF